MLHGSGEALTLSAWGRLLLLGHVFLSGCLFAHNLLAQGSASLAEDSPFRVIGFADFKYVSADDQSTDGFELGQGVAHASVALSDRLNMFGEMSLTAKDSEYKIEMERLIVKYDFSDQRALSAGRFHTPIGYWNTAYHHGAWLQTAVSRPEVVRFGSQIVPIHFVGAFYEGEFGGRASDISYTLGIGNGRHSNIARAGDAGDVNSSRAWSGSLAYQPSSLFGLKAGIGVYGDRVTPTGSPEVDEKIYSAYFAWEHETPEIMAEYFHAEHETRSGLGTSGDTDAFYVQVAYRLSGNLELVKPYVRFENTDVDNADPLLGARGLDYDASIAGVRYDITPYAALKFEYKNEEFGNLGSDDVFTVQFAVVITKD